MIHSTLYRILRPTDVDREYRCYVSTDDGDMVQLAAYYSVNLTAVQGLAARWPTFMQRLQAYLPATRLCRSGDLMG